MNESQKFALKRIEEEHFSQLSDLDCDNIQLTLLSRILKKLEQIERNQPNPLDYD